MPSVGRGHFETYTAQNRVKHAILSKYFARYLQALSGTAEAFHYIDAFAGPGTYASNPGSPLYALDLLSRQAKPYAASFVESSVHERSGATFVLPFRFRAAERERTSHYLIHLSQHPLAFKIMKAVMKSESAGSEDYGSLGFIPQDELVSQGELFHPNAERAKREILRALSDEAKPVTLFTQQWIERPDDMFVEKEYKQLLLELERDSQLEVIDEQTQEPVPAVKRRKRAGSPTLGDRYWVRRKCGGNT